MSDVVSHNKHIYALSDQGDNEHIFPALGVHSTVPEEKQGVIYFSKRKRIVED